MSYITNGQSVVGEDSARGRSVKRIQRMEIY